MSLQALQQIQQIQEKAEQEIAALRQQAVSELVTQLAAARQKVKDLEAEYSNLTGKPITGTFGGDKGVKSSKRHRLTREEQIALVENIKQVLKTAGRGLSIGEIANKTGNHPITTVRNALAKISDLRREGERAATVYLL